MDSQPMTLVFGADAAPSRPMLMSTMPPRGKVGQPYTFQLVAFAGAPPYPNYRVASGALPAGLSLNSATGLISGTFAAAIESVAVSFIVSDSQPG